MAANPVSGLSTRLAAIDATTGGTEGSGPKRAQKIRRVLRREYEDTEQLARRTRTSESYWNKMRVAGEGPPFIKLGRRVLYRPSVVDAWLAKLERFSTSDHGAVHCKRPAGAL
jgi:Helix-turn-helix domain